MPLTSCQRKDARILQLEAANAELRRLLTHVQMRLDSITGPQEHADREQRWKVLEETVGSAIDRQTLEVKA